MKSASDVKKTTAQQIAEVDAVLTLARDYLIDVAVLAILKAREHEIALDLDADGRGIDSGIRATEKSIAERQRVLVSTIAEHMSE